MAPHSKNATCDVLVAGSGAAGFAAALTARLNGLDVLMVEKEPLFGGPTAFSAGVIWIPANSLQRAAGIANSREAALTYLTHHVGNRLDRAKAEAFLDNAPAMIDLFQREDLVSYSLAPTWADYHPEEPGASQGGRSLVPEEYDGRKLGAWFEKLRPALQTIIPLGGMMVGRNDLPHIFQMTRSAKSALHVAGMVARHARDRLEPQTRHPPRQRQRADRQARRQHLRPRHTPVALRPHRRNHARQRPCHRRRHRTRRPAHPRHGPPRRGAGLRRLPGCREEQQRVYAHVSKQASLPPPGNTGDGLRLARSVGGRFHGEVHQPAAWTPVSPRCRRPMARPYRSRISSSAASPATSASTAGESALPTRRAPITCSCRR